MKLHVYMRDLGICSRRKAEELISAGAVRVNGEVAHIGQIVTGNEEVYCEGQVYTNIVKQKEFSYLLMNKPVGYTSTTVTHFTNEKSVLELLPYEVRKQTQWQIVGRLDKNSEGLLLLTDNGGVGYVMTHPRFEISKEYLVQCSKQFSSEDLLQMKKGVQGREGEMYQFQDIKGVSPKLYKVILNEGKKREIREVFAQFGGHVHMLRRITFGPLSLGTLAVGAYRLLEKPEVESLLALVKRTENPVLE